MEMKKTICFTYVGIANIVVAKKEKQPVRLLGTERSKMMKRNDFPALWFPPLTYYKEEGKIDFEKMECELAKIYPYSQGVLIPGSTGDAWVLDDARQEEIVRFFLKGFSFGRFAVMLGALKPTADETLQAVVHWCDVLCSVAGIESIADAMEKLQVKAFVFCVPNGEQDPVKQYEEMSRILACGLPMAFYQLPGVTGVTVDPALIAKLAAENSNLIVAKDSGGMDEMAKSGLLNDRLMLLRGAEGDPSALVRGESPCYDGLLLSTVNCFAKEYAAFMDDAVTYRGFGDVIGEVFEEAGKAPVSNAFSDAVRAICHAREYGEKAAETPCCCYNGKELPVRLLRVARQSLDAHL